MYISQIPNTTSFKMKISELSPVNRYVYKTCFPSAKVAELKDIPTKLEQIQSIDQFYDACKQLLYKIIPKDFSFGGFDTETEVERKAMMGEWYYHITQANNSCSPAMQLMILKSIIKNLNSDEAALPPEYEEKNFVDTINKLQNMLNKNENLSIDFDKTYRNNLENTRLAIKNSTGWYRKGNIHTYCIGDKKLFCVETEGDEVTAIWEYDGYIKSTKNISPCAVDAILSHFKDYELGYNVEEFIDKKLEEQKLMMNLYPIQKNGSTQEILESVGIKCKKDDDGKLIIQRYGRFSPSWTFFDFGIDENKLFKDIKGIEGDACFTDSYLTNTGSVEFISGNADFRNSEIEDLGNLKSIGNNAYFGGSKVKSLKNVESISGRAFLQGSPVTDLGNLKYLGGGANIGRERLKPADFNNIECKGDIWVLKMFP